MITIATALQLGAVAYQTYEQDQTVKAQNKFNEQQAQEGAALANASFKNQSDLARLRESQEAEAASAEKEQNAKSAAEARATARVSAGEAGVAGVSVDSLIADFHRQEAGYSESVDRNLQLTSQQSEEELKGMRTGALDRALSYRAPVLRRPSYMAAAIDGGNIGLATYSRYRYDKTRASGTAQGG